MTDQSSVGVYETMELAEQAVRKLDLGSTGEGAGLGAAGGGLPGVLAGRGISKQRILKYTRAEARPWHRRTAS